MAGEAIVKDQQKKQARAVETVGEIEKEVLHKLENTKALHETLVEKGKAMHAQALDLSKANTEEEKRTKEIASAIIQQLRGEIDYLLEGGLSAARALGRVKELDAELEVVDARAVEMERVFTKGMATYDKLHSLGSRFSDYSEENRETFWPSLLSWLREEKWEDKMADLHSMVSGWEGHLQQEETSRKEYEASLSKIVEFNQEEDDEENAPNAANPPQAHRKKNGRRQSSSHSVTSDGSSKSGASKDKERYQNAIRAERKKKRAREEKIQQLQQAKKKKELDAKESRKLATQRTRRSSSETPMKSSFGKGGRRSSAGRM